ncbi:MAG: Gfo/Idh/MocA family oxidoreductase [Clostridiales bacterium]|jgi:predicted dehydrogenase|nr:Gfo/Idh/MocA family oxidoreductase [Clostridiales bacterium]
MNIAILGAGSRGANVYGGALSRMPDVKISAVCDIDKNRAVSAAERFGVGRENCFFDENAFFEAGVIGDGLVIASMDRDHYRQVVKAIDAGYKKILLEKPVSHRLEEVEEIVKTAKERGVDILVAHVLRYTGFYKTVREIIKAGKIGEVMAINHQENVGYWHFAHSFTRGNWRDSETSAPILLAKTCHDFDLIYWFAESAKCVSVSSYGELSHFKRDRAPEGCAERCLDGCAYFETCPFSVKKLYLDKRTPLGWGMLQAVGKNNPTAQEKLDSLKNPENPYGRCVYFCDNDVADHQIVAMQFDNDVTATLTMTAFSEKCYRRIHIMGTKGELIGCDYDNYLTLNTFGKPRGPFGGASKRVRIKSPLKSGHLGGDDGLCRVFCNVINGEPVDKELLTTVDVTLESHKIIFFAEKARKTGKTQLL